MLRRNKNKRGDKIIDRRKGGEEKRKQEGKRKGNKPVTG